MKACVEMLDIRLVSKYIEQFSESTQPRQLSMTRFSEDMLPYRGSVGKGGMVKLVKW